MAWRLRTVTRNTDKEQSSCGLRNSLGVETVILTEELCFNPLFRSGSHIKSHFGKF